MAGEEDKVIENIEQQTKIPYKIGFALIIGAFLWLCGYVGTISVLLPAKIALIDNSQKATILATISSVAMIVATLANIILGAFSDMTRSRFGRRTPWILIGSVGGAGMLLMLNNANDIWSILVIWLIYQVFLNAIIAPMIAIIADKIPPNHRGVISSFYAVGISGGIYGGTFIASRYIDDISSGLVIMALMTVFSGIICVALVKEGSSTQLKKEKFDIVSIVKNFCPPVKNARDYYLALFGKLMMVSGTSVISGVLLYILTDYSGLKSGSDDVKHYLSIISLIMMFSAILMAACAGYIADRMGRLKLPVVFTAVITSLGLFFPFITSEPWALLVYAILAGTGYGAFQSVDQAMNVAVLPSTEHAAKDLGILNLSNTAGNILGPVIAASIISIYGYQYLFMIAGVVSLLGATMIMCIRSIR